MVVTYFPSLEVKIEATTTARPLENHQNNQALSVPVLVAARAMYSGNLTIHLLLQVNAPAVSSPALARMLQIETLNQISIVQEDQMTVVTIADRYLYVFQIVE
jgi:hypothetical protein